MSKLLKTIATSAICGSLLLSSTAFAGGQRMYEVTVTNITKGEIFTPILVASTHRGVKLFKQGTAASTDLEIIAESGNNGPLADSLISGGHALDTASAQGGLLPGASLTLTVKMNEKYSYVTVASMLVPSNDAFFAVNGIHGPRENHTLTLTSPAYDAGTEVNDELCANIPGPGFICKGEGYNAASGEGYVYTHAGIQGNGDLVKADHDFRNPVAIITIKQIKK
ncbi:MAG: spondin domain-containing protein [Gammaproteobacteria bacterium]